MARIVRRSATDCHARETVLSWARSLGLEKDAIISSSSIGNWTMVTFSFLLFNERNSNDDATPTVFSQLLNFCALWAIREFSERMSTRFCESRYQYNSCVLYERLEEDRWVAWSKQKNSGLDFANKARANSWHEIRADYVISVVVSLATQFTPIFLNFETLYDSRNHAS